MPPGNDFLEDVSITLIEPLTFIDEADVSDPTKRNFLDA